MNSQIQPLFSTTVDPLKYDIDEQMKRMVKLANKKMECYTLMDVGKTWGLYLAWRNLAKGKCEWTEDSDGIWNTDCGNAYVFFEGTPKDNKAKYCLFCGRELIQNEYLSEAIEENTK